jgi:hypothetical protein
MASTLIRRKRFQRLLTPNKQEIDILKLYLAVFKNFKIENNVVFTSSRYIPFDRI